MKVPCFSHIRYLFSNTSVANIMNRRRKTKTDLVGIFK